MVSIVSDELGTTTSRKACISCFGEYSGDFTVCPEDGATLTVISDNSLVGTILDDRYEILDVIGSGGMGMVYRAKQRFINRMVAVKVLHKGSITGTEIIKRFQQEAQAASALTSPHVVTVFDSNVSRNGEPYLVMDLLNGASLETLLEQEKSLTPVRAINIFLQVCDALAKAHSKNIVHRDIKPSNIVLVEEDGQKDFVKVVDFGIAKILRESESGATQLTRTGEVFGSPLYMSPEQWRGAGVDSRTDIYSLGAVMYKTLTGVSMFDTTDILQLAYKQAHETPASITALGIKLPHGLEAIVFKALAKDAAERFQSVNEMVAELVSIREAGKAKLSGAKVSDDTQTWLKELTPANQKSVSVDQTVKTRSQPDDISSLPTLSPSQSSSTPQSSSTHQSSSTAPSQPSSTSLPVASISSSGDSKQRKTEEEQTVQLVIPKKHLKVIISTVVLAVAVAVAVAAFYFGEQSRSSKAPATQLTEPNTEGSSSLVEPSLVPSSGAPSRPDPNPASSSPNSTSVPVLKSPPKPGTASPPVHSTKASKLSASSTPSTAEEHAATHKVHRHAYTHSTSRPGLLKRILHRAF